jgi:hypothetical protein
VCLNFPLPFPVEGLTISVISLVLCLELRKTSQRSSNSLFLFFDCTCSGASIEVR